MELYDSEEQQVEAIKDWWTKYGKAVVIGVVIGIAAIIGWNYHERSKQAELESASHDYASVLTMLKDKSLANETKIQKFIDTHSDSEYAVLTAMQLAKTQIDAKHLDKALAQLNWAKAHTKDDALSTLLAYRIARVEAEQGNYDKALTSLNTIKDDSWKSRVAELKGDILLRKGDKDAAYIQYSEAQQSNDAGQAVQMKLNDLAK